LALLVHAQLGKLTSTIVYVRKWLAVYEVKHDRPKLLKALREATKGFVAITDTPGTHFIEELCEIYPDATVVCWRRDPQRWWKSMEQMIKRSMPPWLHWYLILMPGWRWFPSIMSEMSKKCVGVPHTNHG
jgi:hypothetical protein